MATYNSPAIADDIGDVVERLRRDIVGLEQEVPLLDGSYRPCVYLDNAASTPAFRTVQRKVNELLQWYSSVNRGASFKSMLSTRAYEESRRIVIEFVGGDPQVDLAVFGKNTTEAINKLAYRLPLEPEDVVICTAMEHHSNDLPWRARARVVYVGLKEDKSLDVDDLARKLAQYEGRVKLVATTGASNVTGYTPPIYEMAELAHRYGARILVDCAQLAPHRAVTMGPHDSPRRLDFVTLSAHKMYAPYGTGALVGSRDFFARGTPEYRGGGTIDLVTADDVYWAGPPGRDEAGSPNLVGAVAMATAMRRLQQVGMPVITDHERELTMHTLRRLQTLEGLTVYGSADPQRVDDRLGVISFSVQDMHHGKVAAILGFEGGIAVRNGRFCAHPYVLQLLEEDMERQKVLQRHVLQGNWAQIPGLVRVSFGCYNDRDDVDHLVLMLEKIIAGEYAGDYAIDESSGDYWPRQFNKTLIEEAFTI